jgi:hypothetical protein
VNNEGSRHKGKSTAQVDKALQANQEDLKAALARIERK